MSARGFTRKAISKKLRFEIFKRDFFQCQYCGATPPGVMLHVDHITPVSDGGKNGIDNLITACEACNLGKSATPLSSVPKSLRDKSSDVLEKEEQIRGYNAILEARAERIEGEAWRVAAAIEGQERIDSFNRANLLSIKKFLEKLPVSEVIHSAEIAFAKNIHSESRTFTYFCGVCWSKIRESNNAKS